MNSSSKSTAENRIAAANAAAAAAAATNRTFTSPAHQQRPSITTIPQPRHSYPSPHQQKQTLFTAQSHSTITTTRHPNPNPSLHPQFHRPHDALQPQQQPPPPPHQSILYPVSSSGRGYIQRPIRPQPPPDQTVTVANPGAYPSRPVITFPRQVARPFGFSNSESLNHPVHMIAPPYVQHPNIGVTTGAVLAPIRVPVSAHPKVASSPSTVSDSNGYKDLRERSKEDVFVTIRDRKVRIRDGASLYSLCRSWLRNGSYEESQVVSSYVGWISSGLFTLLWRRQSPIKQKAWKSLIFMHSSIYQHPCSPQNGDGAKCLPRPLPIPVPSSHLPTKKEVEGENEGSVQHLSAEELLQRHIQRAKRVRARLREERLQRIARYKARLATLLPPPVEQSADDTAA